MKNYTLNTGKDVTLDITFRKLKALQASDSALYNKVNAVLMASDSSNLDVFSMVDFLYGCYVMANPDPSTRLSEDTFMDGLGFDMQGIGEVVRFLLTSGQQAPSQNLS